MLHPEHDIAITLDADEHGETRAVVLNGLRGYNRERAEPPDYRSLVVAARDRGRVIGGLIGETAWRWLFIELLWVADAYRGRGLGRRLLRTAEEEALQRGARHVYLDTFEFQAPAFYEKEGYEIFGVLDDYPPAHRRFYMRKDLVPH